MYEPREIVKKILDKYICSQSGVLRSPHSIEHLETRTDIPPEDHTESGLRGVEEMLRCERGDEQVPAIIVPHSRSDIPLKDNGYDPSKKLTSLLN